jgi:transposase
MDTQPVIVKQERIDDVPLLLGMMRQMKIAEIMDKNLGEHHLHQGLSNGNLAIGWIAFILSQSDHRKSAVQDWASGLEQTLESFYGQPLLPNEFSDDRLGIVAAHLSDTDWDALESTLFDACFEVYELPKKVFRVDATATCGYHTIEPDGIMQLGHTKDHRPDLPQLKIMAAVTQPLGFPVSTAIVPGNQADDVLYWHTIVQVKKKVGGSELLFVGDCKMASVENRARIANAGDYYLTPLPNTGETAKLFGSWIETALQKEANAELQTIHKPTDSEEPDAEEPEVIGQGYEFKRTLQERIDDRDVTWTERVQMVQATSQLDCQKTKLRNELRKAEEKLGRLTLSGKGRKIWRDEQELRGAIKAIEQEHGVEGFLAVELSQETLETKKYGKSGRPGEKAVAVVTREVRYRINSVKRNEEQIAAREKRLGWRAFVSNAPEQGLNLEESVLTYREGGGLERPFHQLKDAPLGIRPLFVRLPEQIVGLTRLLLIALRVQTLIEIVLRGRLAETGEKLEGLYEGQQSRLEGKPTGKRLLRAIAGLEMTLSLIHVGVRQWWFVPALPRLLVRVLDLLGLSASLYTNLTNSGPRSPSAGATPSLPISSG